MKDLVSYLSKRNKVFWGITGVFLVLLMGVIDYITGYELSFALFYLIPISLVAWFGGRRPGLLISTASALAWFGADFLSGARYSNPSIYVWNTLLRLGFFWVVTLLLSALQQAYKVNQDLAQTDYVTGAGSTRHFYEMARIESDRFRRYNHIFSLVYFDLDNFKTINDRLGHITGDKLLRVLTENIQQNIRPSDTLGRLGGDEFAILLPETDEEQAKKCITRLHSHLTEEMLSQGWMVTFSMSVITLHQLPKSVDEMVKLADTAMYSVKANGKNGVCYRTYNG
jgi:diguanylate cyclase (GGDEF)-like protein